MSLPTPRENKLEFEEAVNRAIFTRNQKVLNLLAQELYETDPEEATKLRDIADTFTEVE